jgi:glycosyltransferase involved in cell wall biosynthesis
METLRGMAAEPSAVRVVHFNTNEVAGGAAKAALRLHRALRDQGIKSRMVVLNRDGDDPDVKRVGQSTARMEASLLLRDAAHKAVQYLKKPNDSFDFDLNMFSAPTSALAHESQSADILHLHWVRGLLSTGQIRRMATGSAKPVVWTLMDLAPLTGGCHYPGDCRGYEEKCGRCPVLRSDSSGDASRRTWRRRRRHFSEIPLTIVAPTRWVAERASRSSLLSAARCEMIPLSVDTGLFRPGRQQLAREVLALPPTAFILFCGAQQLRQERKGLAQLVGALHRFRALLESNDPDMVARVLLVTAGPYDPSRELGNSFRQVHVGVLRDDRILALAHQAADLFISPSLEDAGPLMLNEAMACGVPSVAFQTGGAVEWLAGGERGYAARVGDVDDLAFGMVHFARNNEGRLRAGLSARAFAEREFSPSAVATRYADLYDTLCG